MKIVGKMRVVIYQFDLLKMKRFEGEWSKYEVG